MSTHTHTSALALWVLKLCCSCHTVRIRMVTVWEQHRPVPVQFPELAFRRALWTTGKCRKKMLSCTSHIITTDTNTHSRCYWHFFAVLNHVIVHRNVQWECSMRMSACMRCNCLHVILGAAGALTSFTERFRQPFEQAWYTESEEPECCVCLSLSFDIHFI